MAELQMDEARLLWLSQPTAPKALSREEILRKAKEFETRSRLKIAVVWILVILLVVFGIYDANMSIAFAKFLVACLLVLTFEKAYGHVQQLDFVRLGLNEASGFCLAFYRTELLRRRRFFERSYRRILIPSLFLILQSLPFVGLSLRSGAMVNLIPVGVLLITWLAFTIARKNRELPAIEREIEALNAVDDSRAGRE